MNSVINTYEGRLKDTWKERFDAETNTRNGNELWGVLSTDYVSRVRIYPDKKKLVHDLNKPSLKKSIKCFFAPSKDSDVESFIVIIGNELAELHNKGYSFTTRTSTNYGTTMGKQRKIKVPARPCIELPVEFDRGGKEYKKFKKKVFDIVCTVARDTKIKFNL